MTAAYVDTSVLVAVSFNEKNSTVLATRLSEFSRLVASNLVEAELRAVFARERCRFSQDVVADIEWILPDRRLSAEISTVLEAGYVRGADLWHLATALYAAGAPGDMGFITCDQRQGRIAAALGFQV